MEEPSMDRESTMSAAIFRDVNYLPLEEMLVPTRSSGEAVIQVTMRIRQLMKMVRRGLIYLAPSPTNQFKLGDVVKGHDLFGHQRDGVLKLALSA